jgi:hypothetical protein
MDIIWLNVTFQIEDALPIQVMHNAGIHILLISPILWPGENRYFFIQVTTQFIRSRG